MSINRYDSTTQQLTSLAGGTRTWVGTKAAYDAEKLAGTLPNNCLIVITDDEEELAQEVIQDDPRAVTSGGVYEATKTKQDYNGYKCSFTRRNLSLTFTNGVATFDATSQFTTSEFIGVAIFPYNDIENAKVTSNNGILTIRIWNSTLSGTYYCSIMGFYYT